VGGGGGGGGGRNKSGGGERSDQRVRGGGGGAGPGQAHVAAWTAAAAAGRPRGWARGWGDNKRDAAAADGRYWRQPDRMPYRIAGQQATTKLPSIWPPIWVTRSKNSAILFGGLLAFVNGALPRFWCLVCNKALKLTSVSRHDEGLTPRRKGGHLGLTMNHLQRHVI